MFHFITALIGLYVSWRLLPPFGLKKPARILLTAFILLISEHHLISRNFFGTMASPELPSTLLILLGWLFGTLTLLAALLLAADSGRGARWLWARQRRSAPPSPQHRPHPPEATDSPRVARLNALLGALALILSGIGVHEAVRSPDVRTVDIELARLPGELDGFNIVQLSDLHASRLLQAPWIESVVEISNRLDPDLILITGDLIDGTPEARAADIAPLARLKAPQGVLAIAGNHEYYASHRQWLSAFEDLGLRLLLNEHVVVGKNGAQLIVAGITDRAAERVAAPMPDLAAALAGAPDNTFTVLMAHRPDVARQSADAGVDLQLSGHTHGGQILGLHWITQYANDGFISGLYRVGTMALYVSNGTGLWNGFPLRLGRPSEITRIRLHTPRPASPPIQQR